VQHNLKHSSNIITFNEMDESRSMHGHKNTHLLHGKMKEKTKRSSDLDWMGG
jgi:hypothetical protein